MTNKKRFSAILLRGHNAATRSPPHRSAKAILFVVSAEECLRVLRLLPLTSLSGIILDGPDAWEII